MDARSTHRLARRQLRPYIALGAGLAALIGTLLAGPLTRAFAGHPPWVLPAIITGTMAAILVLVLVALPAATASREKRAP
jgi:hypothetical protein